MHHWRLLRRLGVFSLVSGLMALAPGAWNGAFADDVGVTLQTSKSAAYKGTKPLSGPIVTQLKGGVVNTDDPAVITETLRKLKDGDILVVVLHSNPNVFALGDKTYPWRDFWKTFGINRPPRLAAAILGGCMFETIGEEKIKPIEAAKVRELRDILNAELIYTPNGPILYFAAIINANQLLSALHDNKKLHQISLGGRWRQSVSDRWMIQDRWKDVTLSNLRRVNASSRAYEAGVVAGLRKQDVDSAVEEYTKEPTMAQAFRLGHKHATDAAPKKIDEYEELRKKIEEGQKIF